MTQRSHCELFADYEVSRDSERVKIVVVGRRFGDAVAIEEVWLRVDGAGETWDPWEGHELTDSERAEIVKLLEQYEGKR